MTRRLLLLLALLPALACAEELPRAEQKALTDVAKRWGKLATWCAKRKLGEQARWCAEQAREALPEDPSIKALVEAVRDLAPKERASALAQWERQRERTIEKVVPLYDALAGRDGVPPRRAVAYLERAQRLAPADERLPALERLRDLLAVDGLVLLQASAHPIKYYLSLPRGWRHDAGRRWPVLVCVDGAGSSFKGIAAGYRKARGGMPFLVVSPCTFANTNALQGKLRERYLGYYDEETIAAAEEDRFAWDEAGLLAILDDLQGRFGAEERVYMTGFSGGGNLTYLMIFKHPDLLSGAAPACANYAPRGYARLEGRFDLEARTLPIRLITGAKDPHRRLTHGKEGSPGIEPQTDWAVRDLEAVGYPHLQRVMVPGLGHSPAHAQVLEALGPYLRGERGRGDPLPAPPEGE